MTEILAGAEQFRRRGIRYAVATIVSTHGSTYRRPGARLLVSDLGRVVGAISGGCLEAEVAGIAGEVISSQRPRIVDVDHRAHDEAVWGWGLGCSGSMTLFVEPGDDPVWLDALATVRDRRRPVALITVLTSTVSGLSPGSHMNVDPGGHSDVGLGKVTGPLLARARRLMPGTGSIEEMTVPDGAIRVFVEMPEVPTRLLVCGAGLDAVPLLRMATVLGWSSILADDRQDMAALDGLPSETRFMHLDRPEEIRDLPVDPWTYAVVMTHHYARDRRYLAALLDTPTPYIGVLGPRARLARLRADLSSQKEGASAEERERIFGPAGLDLGGEGAEEIAAAIVGEVLSVRRGRPGGRLRDRPGRIHHPPENGFESAAQP